MSNDDQQMDLLTQQLINAFAQFRRIKWDKHSIEGIRHSDMMLLFVIKKHIKQDSTGLMVSEISQILRVTPPTITQQIKGLESEGLIERTMDPIDRRAVRVKLTQRGEAIARQVEQERINAFGGLRNFLGEEECSELIELLNKSYSFFKSRQAKEE